MPCHDSHLYAFADHKHGHVTGTELLLQVLRVSRESEALGIHRPLVYRRGDQYIYLSIFQSFDGTFQRRHRRFCRIRGCLARLYQEIVRKAVHDVHDLRLRILCGTYHVSLDITYIVQSLPVETESLP